MELEIQGEDSSRCYYSRRQINPVSPVRIWLQQQIDGRFQFV